MKSDKPIHLVLLTPGFPANEQDTNCIPPLQSYVQTLAAQSTNYQVTVLSLHYPFQKATYTWKGVSVQSLGAANCAYPLRMVYWLRYVWALVQLHRRTPIHRIHAFWLHECSLLGSWVAFILKIPIVATVMGQDAVKPNRFTRLIRFKNTHLVALSTFQAEQLYQHFAIQVQEVVPWGIDIINPQNYIAASRDIDILGVGSHIPLKNYTLFVHTIGKLYFKYPHLKVHLVGDGVQHTALRALADSLGVGNIITFAGHIPRQQVLALMGRSKLFLHTSLYESQGYVLWEALHLGCYVVSYPVGIAQKHPKWLLIQDENDFFSKIDDLFSKNNLVFESEFVVNILNTFYEYDIIYKKLSRE